VYTTGQYFNSGKNTRLWHTKFRHHKVPYQNLSLEKLNSSFLQEYYSDYSTNYDPVFESRQGQKIYLYSKTSRPVLVNFQRPTPWVPEFLLWGVNGRGFTQTIHLQPVPRLRINGSPLPLLLYVFTACIGSTVPLPPTTFGNAIKFNHSLQQIFILYRQYMFRQLNFPRLSI